MAKEQASTEQEAPQVTLNIQKLYIQDLSFESPHAPEVFMQEWQPEANIEINTNNDQLDENLYEVTLQVTLTAKAKEQTAFLVEVKQVGVFNISGIDVSQMGAILGSYCPGILFPYAREAIANLISKGGFPAINIAPVNFDVLYQQAQQQKATT